MNQDQLTEQKIAEALSSVEGIRRASANPFLYTRIQARLQRKQPVWEKIESWITRPGFAVLVIAMAVTLNLWVAINNNGSRSISKAPAAQTEQDFALEYSTVNYAFSEPVNNK
jgi:hypothetical protein